VNALDRLRRKNTDSYPRQVTEVPKAPSENTDSYHGRVTKVPKATSVTFDTPIGEVFQFFEGVEYQPIFFDFAVADGSYTPAQLHKAGFTVKPWGQVRTYTVRWSTTNKEGS
jgi:hypothetical protein